MNKKKISILALMSMFALIGCNQNPASSSSTSEFSSLTSESSSNSVESISSSSEVLSSELSSSESISSEESSSESSIDHELETAKKEALEYINSLDLSIYREEEKQNIEAMIEQCKAIINNEKATAAQINNAIQSLKTYIASQKTNAQYEQEEEQERQKLLSEAKQNKIDEIQISEPNQYRSEELSKLNDEKEKLSNQINACTSIEELNSIDISAFQSLVQETKTNADYFKEEIINYPLASEWDLVNEHASQWTLGDNGINTCSVGYLLDSANTYDDCVFSFTLNSSTAVGVGGILKARPNPTSDGLDGYLINISTDTVSTQFVQVYYLENAYCGPGEIVKAVTYIGGWIYPGSVRGTTFKIEFNGPSVSITTDDNSSSDTIVVDLTNNGQFPLISDTNIGILNWDPDRNYQIDVNKLYPLNKTISSIETAKKLANDYIQTVDLNKYRTSERQVIENAISSLTTLMDSETTYEEILNGLNSLKSLISEQKTDEEYTKEENANNLAYVKEEKIASLPSITIKEYPQDSVTTGLAIIEEAKTVINACQSIEEVNGLDLSEYISRINALTSYASITSSSIINSPTTSDWDLVREHTATWTYDGSTPNTVKTNQVGWQLNDTTYDDFDIVFSVNNSQDIARQGIFLRANKSSSGDGIDGYLINLVSDANNQFIQVWYMDAAWGSNEPNVVCDYVDGYIHSSSVKDVQFRIRLDGNMLYIFLEQEYQSGNINPCCTINLGVKPTIYQSGFIGMINWDGTDANINIHRLIKK